MSKETGKPFGSAVVEAHRLLKNNIDLREYVLVTDKLPLEGTESLSFSQGSNTYEKHGEIRFHYADLSQLLNQIPDPPKPDPPQKVENPISASISIHRPLDHVYEIISNLELRKLWNKQTRDIQFDEGLINRVGLKHRCLFENGGEADIETVTQDFGEGKIALGEKPDNVPLTKEFAVFWVMEELSRDEVKVTMEVHHIPNGLLGKVFGFFLKKKFKKEILPTLKEIKTVCESYE